MNADNVALRRAARAAMVRWDTIEPTRWSQGFAALKELGFDAVDLPIIWSQHEREDRSMDFRSPRRDVCAVVRAARREGLGVRLRVGPRCVETEQAFGVPRWLLADAGALARNARRGAVLEPVGLVPTPAPSFASSAFREASASWIRAVIEHLRDECLSEIDAITIGAGTFAPLRADAIDTDHHSDAGPVSSDPVEREVRATRLIEGWYQPLIRAALEAGLSPDQLRVSLIGTRSSAIAASSLAKSFRLDSSTPFASTGTGAIWHEVSSAIASTPHGAHFDVGCGSAPFARPLRNRDAAAAARVVIAAGAASLSVRYAWAGDGWVGSLLDAKAVVQRAAMRWKALFDECASIHAAVVDPTDEAQPERSWLTPVYRGWLAQYDLLSRPEPHDTLSPLRLSSQPERSAFARRDGDRLVLISASEKSCKVIDHERRWLSSGELELAPGAVVSAGPVGGVA